MEADLMDPLASSVRELQHDAKGTRFDEQTLRVLNHFNDHHLCDRCGKCCTEQNVGMTGPEIIVAAGFLGLKCSEFKKLYIEKQIGRWHIVRKVDGRCSFLEMIRDPPDDEGKELLIGNDVICPNMSKTFKAIQGGGLMYSDKHSQDGQKDQEVNEEWEEQLFI
jgi:hypothetical protein